MDEKIEKHFSKLYCFNQPVNDDKKWLLPPVSELFQSKAWTNQELALRKQELNAVKSLLNDKDIVKWRQHTQNVNFSGKVVQHLRANIQPELCTQAWCKFYEIVCSCPQILSRPTFECLNSVHLCEAPGAFVAALNHYLVLNCPGVNLKWLATTLNPHYEGNRVNFTVTDDRFICPTLNNWDFGADNTGNIFTKCNRQHLMKRTDAMGPINLVTADGSIDCQEDPSEQESTVAKLHLAEVVLALHILTRGGSLVIKMFTCYEHTSVSILYLLNCTFRSVQMYKPGTSKMGNSEVYVVALNYVGASGIMDYLSRIEEYMDNEDDGNAMFSMQSFPVDFMNQVIECCHQFKEYQIEAISTNLKLFETMDSAQRIFVERTKSAVATTFIKRFGLGPIFDDAVIVGNKNMLKFCVQLKPWQVGSFNSRIKQGQLPFDEKLTLLESCLQESLLQVGGEIKCSALLCLPEPFKEIEIAVVRGKEFDTCYNSRFCQAAVLKLWHDMMGCTVDLTLHKDVVAPDLNDEHMALNFFNQLTHTGLDFSKVSVVALDPTLAKLSKELENYFNAASPGETGPNKSQVKLILANVCYGPSHWGPARDATKTEKHLERFCEVFEAFEQLHRECNTFEVSKCSTALIFLTNLPLTRVGVGLLYILHKAFRKVSLHSVGTTTQPIKMFVCQDYVNPIPSFILETIRSQVNIEDGTILEVVSIIKLLDAHFYQTVHQFNCHALLHDMMCLLRTLKQLPECVY